LPSRKGTPWFGISTGLFPVFSHPVTDIASFRFFTSQLIANGNASQSEISRAFGVPLVSVKRACKTLRDEGAAGFFRPPVPRQGHKLTEQCHRRSHRHRTQRHRNLLSRHHPPPRLPPNQVIYFPARSGCLILQPQVQIPQFFFTILLLHRIF
jgi:hypothetical protein